MPEKANIRCKGNKTVTARLQKAAKGRQCAMERMHVKRLRLLEKHHGVCRDALFTACKAELFGRCRLY